ncbi:MAG: nucleotide exchange factor GrpE [Candidatus Nitrosocaldaceae archaeon]
MEEPLDYEAKYKYLLAEYDNYRKRVEKDAEIRILDAKSRILLNIINIRDDLERAINICKKSNDINTLLEGLDSIIKHIDDILSDEGVHVIDTKDKKFDPNLHEIISLIDNDELPEHTIVNELRRGYKLNDRVIRPSLVEVSRRKEK